MSYDVARENGLEPLAKIIMAQNSDDIDFIASKYLNDKVLNEDDAISGAEDIIAGVSSVEATYVRSLVDGRVLHGDIELGALEGEAKYLAFAQRIIQNAENAELATVAIVSKQQGLEVRARLAKSIEELDEIVW